MNFVYRSRTWEVNMRSPPVPASFSIHLDSGRCQCLFTGDLFYFPHLDTSQFFNGRIRKQFLYLLQMTTETNSITTYWVRPRVWLFASSTLLFVASCSERLSPREDEVLRRELSLTNITATSPAATCYSAKWLSQFTTNMVRCARACVLPHRLSFRNRYVFDNWNNLPSASIREEQ